MLNKIASFHVTENFFVGIMHDLLEGVCKYVMENIINQIIVQDKLISLEVFNSKLKYFN